MVLASERRQAWSRADTRQQWTICAPVSTPRSVSTTSSSSIGDGDAFADHDLQEALTVGGDRNLARAVTHGVCSLVDFALLSLLRLRELDLFLRLPTSIAGSTRRCALSNGHAVLTRGHASLLGTATTLSGPTPLVRVSSNASIPHLTSRERATPDTRAEPSAEVPIQRTSRVLVARPEVWIGAGRYYVACDRGGWGCVLRLLGGVGRLWNLRKVLFVQ